MGDVPDRAIVHCDAHDVFLLSTSGRLTKSQQFLLSFPENLIHSKLALHEEVANTLWMMSFWLIKSSGYIPPNCRATSSGDGGVAALRLWRRGLFGSSCGSSGMLSSSIRIGC